MLNVNRLEERDNPAPLIPGWSGAEESMIGNFIPGHPQGQIAVVAQEGGSCRVMLFDGPKDWNESGQPPTRVLLDTIVFDPNFRGGGHLQIINDPKGVATRKDTLFVVPGAGGGPVVQQIEFNSVSGMMELSISFFAPYDQEFRGGLRMSSADLDRDGVPEMLFLPREGGSPRLLAVDMLTHETELSIFVGDPNDYSGAARFEATGGTAKINGVDYILIQYGEIVDGYAESRLFVY